MNWEEIQKKYPEILEQEIMNYMTDIEITKCIELGRKYLDIEAKNIIECIRSEFGKEEFHERDRKIRNKYEFKSKLELTTKIACNYLNENIEELLTPKGNGSGRKELNRIRQIVSLIAYNDYKYTYYEIADYLIRNHATILIARRKAVQYYEKYEKQFKIDVDNCRKKIEETLLINQSK